MHSMSNAADIATSVVFARDTGSGRIAIDAKGRPRVHYWPAKETQQNVLKVGAAWRLALPEPPATGPFPPASHT